MELKQEKIDALRKLIATPGHRIAVVSHVNPDGDAIGSGLAWNGLLNKLTAQATGCRVVAGPVEATAIGNIKLQAEASGELSKS